MIRRYRECDLEGAAAVFTAAFAAPPWNEEWSAEVSRKRISELMSAPQSIGYVYEDDGRIKAVLCGYAKDELVKEGVIAMALMTTKGYPSEKFYIKNGFEGNEGMIFMYRVLDKK